jgi:hypothetical protein
MKDPCINFSLEHKILGLILLFLMLFEALTWLSQNNLKPVVCFQRQKRKKNYMAEPHFSHVCRLSRFFSTQIRRTYL